MKSLPHSTLFILETLDLKYRMALPIFFVRGSSYSDSTNKSEKRKNVMLKIIRLLFLVSSVRLFIEGGEKNVVKGVTALLYIVGLRK